MPKLRMRNKSLSDRANSSATVSTFSDRTPFHARTLRTSDLTDVDSHMRRSLSVMTGAESRLGKSRIVALVGRPNAFDMYWGSGTSDHNRRRLLGSTGICSRALDFLIDSAGGTVCAGCSGGTMRNFPVQMLTHAWPATVVQPPAQSPMGFNRHNQSTDILINVNTTSSKGE